MSEVYTSLNCKTDPDTGATVGRAWEDVGRGCEAVGRGWERM